MRRHRRRWEAGWPVDDNGTIVVNGAPIRDYDENFDAVGPLAWAISQVYGSVSSIDKLPAPKSARLLYPWLIAAGWLPPENETAKPDVTPWPAKDEFEYRDFPAWLQAMPVDEVIALIKGGSKLASEYVSYCDAMHRAERRA